MTSQYAALLVAAAIVFFVAKSRLNYLRLPELAAEAPGAAPDIAVIIPARNEERNIARAVASFPGLEVWVVDDASSDRTAEAARAAGARVIAAPELKAGVLGKPNACLAGAGASRSKWLLFVDADTWYEPGFAGSLARYAERSDLEMVSVFLRQKCGSQIEEILLPYAFALYFCGVNGRSVNDPRASECLANGQCLLFRRDAYEVIGGHGAVAGSAIEDVALARIAKLGGVRTRVIRAEHQGRVRMYDGFGAIWRGFQKNAFRFLLMNPWSGLQVIAASIALTSYLPVLVWLAVERLWLAALALALVPTVALLPWYARRRAALWAPAAIYLFQLVALNAMLCTALGIRADWKGRRV